MSEVSCESPLDSPCVHPFFLNLSDSFSFVLLSFDAVSLCLLFSLSSTITLGLTLLYFGCRTNFFTRQSPPGRTNTKWPLVHLA